MPHKKNPAQGHNPFGAVGNAKSGPPTSSVTTKRKISPAQRRATARRAGATTKRIQALGKRRAKRKKK